MKNIIRIKNVMFLIVIVVTTSCANQKNNESVYGLYFNKGEVDVVHFVRIDSNGTYLHHYEKKGEVKEQTGAVKVSLHSDGKHTVYFDQWCSYGLKDDFSCDSCGVAPTLFKGEIFFSIDLRKEYNFKK